MYADILRAVSHSPAGIRPTHIMQKANMNQAILWNECLPTLVFKGLLSRENISKNAGRGRRPLFLYFITEKGSMFIKSFDEALKLLGYPPDTMFNNLDGR